MTVKELIRRLQLVDPEAEVFVPFEFEYVELESIKEQSSCDTFGVWSRQVYLN